jgi:hypothetical protein
MVNIRMQQPNTHLGDRVEELRTTGDLHHRERLALRGPCCTDRKRDQLNLGFQDAGHPLGVADAAVLRTPLCLCGVSAPWSCG